MENNDVDDKIFETNNLIKNNYEIKKIFKDILNKISNQKKYKANSIEMLKELKNKLKEASKQYSDILNKNN